MTQSHDYRIFYSISCMCITGVHTHRGDFTTVCLVSMVSTEILLSTLFYCVLSKPPKNLNMGSSVFGMVILEAKT